MGKKSRYTSYLNGINQVGKKMPKKNQQTSVLNRLKTLKGGKANG